MTLHWHYYYSYRWSKLASPLKTGGDANDATLILQEPRTDFTRPAVVVVTEFMQLTHGLMHLFQGFSLLFAVANK